MPNDDYLYTYSEDILRGKTPCRGYNAISDAIFLLAFSGIPVFILIGFTLISYFFFNCTIGAAVIIGVVSFILFVTIASCFLVTLWKRDLRIAAEAAVIIEILENKNPQLKEGR